MKHCPQYQVKMSHVNQNGDLSPIWFLHTLSHVNKLEVHTILFRLPFGSNFFCNSTLAMGKVECQVGQVVPRVACLEVLIMTVDMGGGVKYC